jgi:hypothetical protein
MHDYTAQQVHEDRMRELTREADAHRLAAAVRRGRSRRDRGPGALGWLPFSTFRHWFDARRSPRAAGPQTARSGS